MRTLKIAHIVSNYLFRNGTWIYNQISHLKRWQPIILCRQTENLDVYPISPIYSLDRISTTGRIFNKIAKRILRYYPLHLHAIKQKDVALIHAHFGPEGFHSLGLSQISKVPLLTTFYGYDLSQLPLQEKKWRKRYRKLFHEGDAFSVEGPHMREQLIDLGCPPEKVHLHRLGVNLDQLPFKTRKIEEDGILRILTAGTFTEKKGLPYALEAFARANAVFDNLMLTVIGDARDIPGEQAIKRKLYAIVADHDIEDIVNFLGSVPHAKLIENYYQHHLFISPSVQAADGDNEGGAPVTIIEASATGMPVLSTTHCDIPEVIIDGKSGYLVEERNMEALTDRLCHLIENPSKWPSMGSEGRKHIEKYYNAVVQAISLENFYDSLIF